VTGRFAQVSARDAADVESVLALLREAAVPIEDLEIGRADLEDVFLDIMTAEHEGESARRPEGRMPPLGGQARSAGGAR
jgi:ABC-2 type transport system ATP-binding protein